MNSRILGLMGLTLAGSLTLAACGTAQPEVQPTAAASTEAAGGTTPTEAAASSASAVELDTKTLDTFVYEPNTWTTTAGAETTINLDNSAGTQEHTWVVLNKGLTKSDGMTLTEADTAKFVFATKATAGQKQSDTFTAPTEKGDYVVICTVAGHTAGGMTGTLTVN
jgi:uncharacterized cupredoxin-like copper-binding protein